MSRSRKKRPFASYCGGSQKRDKRVCNRAMRRSDKVSLRLRGEEALYLRPAEALNPYNMAQDGPRYYRPRCRCPSLGWKEWFLWVVSK